MYTVRVEADFAAAHFLKNYPGKCEQLHGHNYRVRACARGKVLDNSGMLYDFTLFKKALRGILENLDHKLLNELPAFSETGASAERIAEYIFRLIKSQLPDCPLYSVEVFETDTSLAVYSED
jgi:6-pyruvoyltetrahydropterin/6-carboxytetrahydropterin synthase